ncbi:MAG: T9SS type A sorting domain-containing protein [Crocinitomicaceae bacterium]|nr:T9SS type A sorting domain-containing protein [Crocinitomicaceae bacterium]
MKNNLFLSTLFVLAMFAGNAATIYVNSATGNDANAGSSASPYKTFHKAYTMAAASGDVINLTGTFDWTASDETGDASVTGYTLTKGLTINGQGSSSTFIQSASSPFTADRCVFTINHDITFNNLTIRNGYNINQTKNAGGIVVLQNIRNNIVNFNNSSIEYNGINNGTTTNYYFAGAIFLDGNTSYHPVLTLTNSKLHHNTAVGKAYGAAGIWSYQDNTINLEGSTLNDNSSTDYSDFGVGYHNVAGALGFFRMNAIKIRNCTISNNTSVTSGAGLLTYYSETFLTNNTIVNNQVTSSAGKGAGIYAVYMAEYDGKLIFKNNIIANNTVNSAGDDINFNTDSWASNIINNGNNIVEFYTGSSIVLSNVITGNQTDLFGTGISLTPTLALNGSTNITETILLSPGSIAINAGSSTSNGSVTIPTTDQRGKTRIGTPDIGSYEQIATREWIGTTSTVSNVTSNWTNSTVPVAGEDVSISASAVNDLVLTGNLTIGTLTFNGANKKVDLGNFDLTLSTITNSNATNYIKSSGTGKLKQTLANNASAIYPIGNSAYNPLTITNKSGASDVFAARVVDGAYMEGLTGAAITSTVLNRTWDISKTNANAGSGVDFVFNWNAGEVANGSFTSPKMNHYSSTTSNWEVPTVTSTTVGSNALTVVGYTGTFSPFTIAEGSSALPVELTAFNANCTENTTTINWQTASEHNSASFDVEKSRDGANWSVIKTLAAAGNSTTTIDYSVVDSEKSATIVYYRLNQIDQDGVSKIYGPISATCGGTNDFTAIVYPNPATEIVTVEMNSPIAQTVSIQICGTDGKAIVQMATSLEEGTTQIPLSIETLKAGVYSVQVNGENATQTIKLVVQ